MNAVPSGMVAEAPLVRARSASDKRRSLYEARVLSAVADGLAKLLDLDFNVAPGSVIGAPWRPDGFPAQSGWAVSRLTVQQEADRSTAYLVQPLEAALDWGGVGLRRPSASLVSVSLDATGRPQLDDAQEQDFLAYAEVCNIVACGTLARAWRDVFGRPMHILLDEVVPVGGGQMSTALGGAGLVAVQAILDYTARAPAGGRAAAGRPPRHAPLLIVLPLPLAEGLLWGSHEEAQERTEALVGLGEWRWSG